MNTLVKPPKPKSGTTLTCQRCGKGFYVEHWRLERGDAHFCSRPCYYASITARDPIGFLHENYIPVPFSGCWLWLGPYGKKGYGLLTAKGGKRSAHRVMLELHEPSPDPALLACHHCDVPACINPDHLFWGTPADNTADALRKNRKLGPRTPLAGEQISNARLTAEMVRAIRASNEPSPVLAARFGVVATCIRKVRAGQTWKHIQ